MDPTQRIVQTPHVTITHEILRHEHIRHGPRQMHETHLHKIRHPQIINLTPIKWIDTKTIQAILVQAHDRDSLNYRHVNVVCSVSYVDILFSGEDGSHDFEWNVSLLLGCCWYDEGQLAE